jgi:NaMN:DMB phosphoribosyltransferase
MAGDPGGDLASPCRRVCTYDAALGQCLGCGRTLEEIGAWQGADVARKQAILAAAEARLAAREGVAVWRAPAIPALAHGLAPVLQERIDEKLKPLGALGGLEEVALRLGLMQGTAEPALRRPGILLFGERLEALQDFARIAGIAPLASGAAQEGGAWHWLKAGAGEVARLAGEGFDTVAPVAGDEGLGERFCAIAPGPAAWRDALDLVAACGARRTALVAGAMIEAASRRMPVLVDGHAVSAAWLALRVAPGAAGYMLFADRPADGASRLMLARLGVCPLLDLEARFAPGVGAALAWPIVAASVAFLRDMATVQSLGIVHRKPSA